MRFLYGLILYVLTPFLLVRLWWKGFRLPAYRKGIKQRFCLDNQQTRSYDLWIHAVSLGEVIAATPLIDAFLKKNHTIIVTTMTPTGLEQVQNRFGKQLTSRYAPYDLPHVVRCFFNSHRPKVGIIMETELWPNLLHYADKAHMPLLLANARLSEKSFKHYVKLKWFFKPILNCLTTVLPQSEADALRFLALGVAQSKINVTGNMKFDLQLPVNDCKQFTEFKNQWGFHRMVVIAASTHHDEESQIAAHLKRLQQAIPGVLLLIAPRHPERFQTIFQNYQKQGFNTGLCSNLHSISPDNEVIIVDNLGELPRWYQQSDYAFVGGSLVPIGGHNVLEPIALKIPVISGNYIHHFEFICNNLHQKKAIRLVADAGQLIDTIIELHHNPELKKQMVHNATVVLQANQGALLKHIDHISIFLEKSL